MNLMHMPNVSPQNKLAGIPINKTVKNAMGAPPIPDGEHSVLIAEYMK
ncbi:hypothetical protein ACFX58_18595 [Sphingomonas sp. NCPPB 2930]